MAPEQQQRLACDVAIVGGGLGGLALAVGLRTRGFDAHVFEAASELRTATSTLIGLGGNAWTALRALDPRTVDLIQAAGVQCQRTKFASVPGPGVPPIVREDVPRSSLYTIRWAEVQRVLSELLPTEAIHCNHRATGFTQLGDAEGGGVEVTFRGVPPVRARLVVAADGLRSVLRSVMFPNDPGPRYLGHMNWNALIHNPGGNTVVDAHGPGELRASRNATPSPSDPFSIMTFVIDAGGGYTFWQVRVVSPMPTFTNGAASLAAQDIGNSSGKGVASVKPCPDAADAAASDEKGVLGAVKGAATATAQAAVQLVARVGVSDGTSNAPAGEGELGAAAGATSGAGAASTNPEASAPVAEAPVHIVGGGLGVPGSKARVLEALRQYGLEHEATVVEATPEAAIFERAMLDRVPLDELEIEGSTGGTTVPRMYSAGGRVVLLGDAAHAMHSGPGQGARTAFEDAHMLADALTRHQSDLGWGGGAAHASAHEVDALAAAASEYEVARLARVCRIQRYAAEGCGLPDLRERYKAAAGVAGLSVEEWRARMTEFNKWTEQYPELPHGDPESKYWQPVSSSS